MEGTDGVAVTWGEVPVACRTKESFMEDTGPRAASIWFCWRDPENGAQCLLNPGSPSRVVTYGPPPDLSPL